MKTKGHQTIEPHQQSLFEPRVQTPHWRSLAPETREAVTMLLAQMLSGHWEREEEQNLREAADE